MISRIAAAFVLVFYISLLTDAGLEFLGLGEPLASELGRDHVLGADELGRPSGRVVVRSSSRARRSRSPCSALVLLLAGIDEVTQPAPAHRARRRQCSATSSPPFAGGRCARRRERGMSGVVTGRLAIGPMRASGR